MKKMLENITTFCSDKLGSILPVGGGAVGAVSQLKQFEYLPTWEAVTSSVIVALIGATVGYFVKLGYDIILYKIRKKYNSK